MQRREMMAGGWGAAACAVAAGGAWGQAGSPPIIAYLGFATPSADQATLDALRRGLADQGLPDGTAVRVEARHAEGDLALAGRYIDELVRIGTAVFVLPGPAAARLVVQRTAIPAVAIGLPPTPAPGDPYGSLARPGGSVTGFSTFGEELSGKRIALLRRTLPRMALLGVLHNVADPVFRHWGEATEAAAQAQGVRTLRLGLSSQSDAELAQRLAELRAAGGDTLLVIRDFLTASLMPQTCRQALDLHVAVMGEHLAFAEAGALMSYGPDLPDLFFRAAGYVARILRGQKPGDLPIQLPTKFELGVNLATARRLDVTFPPDVLFAADRTIEG